MSNQEDMEAAEEAFRREMTRPLGKDDFPTGTTQLQIDAVNTMQNRVDISSFSKDYQQKIRSFYRFAPVNPGSANGNINGGRSFWK